jgi:type I restriction enzyme, S subunit
MTDSWARLPFGELYGEPSRNGLTVPKAERGTGSPMVNMRELFAHDFISDQATELVPVPAESLMKWRLQDGDLLFGRRSLTLEGAGKCSIVVTPSRPTVFESSLIRVRLDPARACPRFFFYLFQSHHGRTSIETIVEQVAVAGIRSSDLARLVVPVPPLERQRWIAGVLGALDDLIDTNRNLMRNLWLAARAAFAEASTHAEPVPARECIELRYGKGLPAPSRRPGSVAVVSSAGIVGTNDEALVDGPGVVVGRKGSVGTVTWVAGDFFPIDTTFYVESKIPKLYCYFALRTMGLEDMNTDSAVPGLNRENALSRPFPRPTREALARFVAVSQPLLDAATQLEREADELIRTRNELLPLLLSGRVRVDEVAA